MSERHLRHLSARPTVVVDNYGRAVGDATLQIGIPGPLGRERVVYALPFDIHGNNRVPGHQYAAPQLIVDNYGRFLAGADDAIIGMPGVWIPRMLVARWTEDTRRLAG